MSSEPPIPGADPRRNVPKRLDPVPPRPGKVVQLTKEERERLIHFFPLIGYMKTLEDVGITKRKMMRYVRYGYLKEIRKVDLDPFFLFADKKTRRQLLFKRIR